MKYLTNLQSAFGAHASDIAIVEGRSRISYARLEQAVNQIDTLIQESGISLKRCAGLNLENRTLAIATIIALFKNQVGYLPLDPMYPNARLEYMIENSDLSLLITDRDIEDIDTAGVKTLKLPPLAELLDQEDQARHPLEFHCQSQDLAYLIYTSGSTGQPKAVMLSHGVLDNLIVWQNKQYECDNLPLRTAQFSSLSFDVSFQKIFSTLCMGGTLYIVDNDMKQDFKRLASYVANSKIQRIFLPNIALQNLVQWLLRINYDGRDLLEVITAGEQLQISPAIETLFKQMGHTKLHNQYGPSESHVVTQLTLEGDPALWPRVPPIGLPIDQAEIYILDEKAKIAPQGEIGEIVISGPVLADGYYQREQETRDKFVEITIEDCDKRCYISGDLGYVDEHGSIVFVGRKDDQVKIDGYRIELAEIETVLLGKSALEQVCVCAFGEQGDRYLIAFYSGQVLDSKAMTDFKEELSKHLPHYMIPSQFIHHEKLAVTPSGKVDRKTIRQAYEQDAKSDSRIVSSGDSQTKISETDIQKCISEQLKVSTLDFEKSLQDQGLSSLKAITLSGEFFDHFGLDIPAYMFFQHPSVRAFIDDVLQIEAEKNPQTAHQASRLVGQDIAIIGMSVSTQDTDDLVQFWSQLIDKQESITFFDDHLPGEYVNARGVLQDACEIDARFFNLTPSEADLIDPQQRLLLKMSWRAIENSGYRLDQLETEQVGVYCGTAQNTYFIDNVLKHHEAGSSENAFQAMIANDKDYAATRIAHKLNLNGPAMTIQTACSTSLVAVCEAVQAIRAGHCDLALAGGASITFPAQQAHEPQEGSILSRDGHTRTFDQAASGTVFSDGGGMVLLKNLDAAVADGDPIWAVIKGAATNNDGANKSSFSAPSKEGQVKVLLDAQHDARIASQEIDYIEAHGTATPIGDPIELAALKRAFELNQSSGLKQGSTVIGSIKSNLGHLTAAAGVVGLIKSAMVCKHRKAPANINFEAPHPDLRLENSPFEIAGETVDFENHSDSIVCGVSSFGIGGTNAHIVLESAPSFADSSEKIEPSSILNAFDSSIIPIVLSAKTEDSLLAMTRDFESKTCFSEKDLRAKKALSWSGRTRWPFRTYLSFNPEESNLIAETGSTAKVPESKPDVVLLFPGQGSQMKGMGAMLYRHSQTYASHLEKCAALTQKFGVDLRGVLNEDSIDINETNNTQIALFCTGYAVASTLKDLGIQFSAALGHSIGEIVAASIAEVFTLEEAIELVIRRGQNMQAAARGSMLAAETTEEELRDDLANDLVISAFNTRSGVTVSGSDEAIDRLTAQLKSKGIRCKKLDTSHAFHSPLMEEAATAFARSIKHIKPRTPAFPIISCVTGKWLTDEQAENIDYWAEQILAPVQFEKGCITVSQTFEKCVAVDCGPRTVASTLFEDNAHQHNLQNVSTLTMLSMPATQNECEIFQSAVGELWKQGLHLSHENLNCERKHLPVDQLKYHFAKEVHRLTPQDGHFNSALLGDYWPRLDEIGNDDLRAFLHGSTFHIASQNGSHLNKHSDAQNELNEIGYDDMPNALTNDLCTLFADMSGLDLSGADTKATFFELGLDSLLLTQVALKIKKQYRVNVSFRQLMSELNSFDTLSEHLVSEGVNAPNSTRSEAPEQPVIQTASQAARDPIATTGNPLEMLFSQQMQLVNSQIDLLNRLSQQATVAETVSRNSTQPIASTSSASQTTSTPSKKPFGASVRINVKRSNELSDDQAKWLQETTSRYCAVFEKSKQFAQQNRSQLADPRVVSGFRDRLKELIFPIVVNRSNGSRLWDIDGNEFIDITCGFGSNFFGNGASFIKNAISEQLETGYEIGPQSPLVESVSRKFCEVTGLQRVAFCSTGSEAVLGAIRLARTVTGNQTIVMFENDYHGINDEVIVNRSSQGFSMPAAAGIPSESVEHVVVLDYGEETSLQYIRENADDIAGILIEPVQSRNPELQPKAFVETLRELCDQNEMALIFDEVITGFRLSPSGAQGYYGVKADIATYGKIIGGGLPIGVIAGKPEFMDALDGGQWRFGDDSAPEVGVTYFAGTFVRHPLALAAANAVLDKLIAEPDIQQNLADKTTHMVQEMNRYAQELGAPVKVVQCQSLFRFKIPQDIAYEELIYILMRELGIHVWDARPCFLTTAHSEDDIRKIVSVFKRALDQMLEAGFLPSDPQKIASHAFDANHPPLPGARLGKDPDGNAAWYVEDPEQPGQYKIVEA